MPQFFTINKICNRTIRQVDKDNFRVSAIYICKSCPQQVDTRGLCIFREQKPCLFHLQNQEKPYAYYNPSQATHLH